MALTNLDDYFMGINSLPNDVDPDLYKEVVILLGFAYKFECRVRIVNSYRWKCTGKQMTYFV